MNKKHVRILAICISLGVLSVFFTNATNEVTQNPKNNLKNIFENATLIEEQNVVQKSDGKSKKVLVRSLNAGDGAKKDISFKVRTEFKKSSTGQDIEEHMSPEKIIFGFKNGFGKKDINQLIAETGVKISSAHGSKHFDIAFLRSGKIADFDSILEKFQSHPAISFAEPDFYATSSGSPGMNNDPRAAEQYHLENWGNDGKIDADVDAPSAWIKAGDCRNILIGVIDSGVDVNHPDLAPHITASRFNAFGLVNESATSYDSSNVNDVTDTNGHGTHVTGIIAAVNGNGIGISGVCKNATVYPIKAGNYFGALPFSAIILGIDNAINSGVKVLNMSFGGVFTPSVAFREAFVRAQNAGISIAVAAGNNGVNINSVNYYPAKYSLEFDNVVTVAATDRFDNLSYYSNYGTSVDIAAPGSAILSAISPTFYSAKSGAWHVTNICSNPSRNAACQTGYVQLDGTSMATPIVAAAMALLRASEMNLNAAQVKQRIISSAEKVQFTKQVGSVVNNNVGPRLNIAKLLNMGVQNTYPSPYGLANNQEYVRHLYRSLLFREPDQGGLDFWTAQLNNGSWNRTTLFLNAFAPSGEFWAKRNQITRDEFIIHLYRNLLYREPEKGGFDFWVGYGSDWDVLNGFYHSQEYQNRFYY